MTENKSAYVIPDRWNMKLLAEPKSGPSGTYMYFIGHHFNGTQECFDVCAAKMSIRPIQVTRHHHREKHEALITWDRLLQKLKKIEETPHEGEGERVVVISPKG